MLASVRYFYYVLKLLDAELDNGDVDALIAKTTGSESLLAPINSMKLAK